MQLADVDDREVGLERLAFAVTGYVRRGIVSIIAEVARQPESDFVSPDLCERQIVVVMSIRSDPDRVIGRNSIRSIQSAAIRITDAVVEAGHEHTRNGVPALPGGKDACPGGSVAGEMLHIQKRHLHPAPTSADATFGFHGRIVAIYIRWGDSVTCHTEIKLLRVLAGGKDIKWVVGTNTVEGEVVTRVSSGLRRQSGVEQCGFVSIVDTVVVINRVQSPGIGRKVVSDTQVGMFDRQKVLKRRCQE